MGFRMQCAPAPPELVLVAAFGPGDEPAALEGADAVLFGDGETDVQPRAVRKMVGSLGGLPWGVWLRDGDVSAFLEAGADFIVFWGGAPAILATSEKPGKILVVDASIPDSLLRAINDLPADAVMLSRDMEDFDDMLPPDEESHQLIEEPQGLTWLDLMDYQRAANLVSKPVLAIVEGSLTAKDIEAIAETSVKGVITRVDSDTPRDYLKGLHEAIASLSGKAKRPRSKMDALLPRLKIERVHDEEEEEGDEGE